jgi:hypothetical protein
MAFILKYFCSFYLSILRIAELYLFGVNSKLAHTAGRICCESPSLKYIYHMCACKIYVSQKEGYSPTGCVIMALYNHNQERLVDRLGAVCVR